MKFRKKPVVIEAERLTKERALQYFTDNKPILGKITLSGSYHLGNKTVDDAYSIIETLEGNMKVCLGDWIVKGVNGEFYPCKNDIFKKTYEPVI